MVFGVELATRAVALPEKEECVNIFVPALSLNIVEVFTLYHECQMLTKFCLCWRGSVSGIIRGMENFPGVIPEGSSDDNETKAEKKDKKDGKELAKKASLLEMFQAKEEKTEQQASKEARPEKAELTEEEKVEQLDTTEQKVVAEQLVDERLETVETELAVAPLGSEQEASAIGAATFLEKLGDKLDDGEIIDDQVLDEVTAEAAAELGIPLEEISHQEETGKETEPELEITEPEPDDEAEADDPAAPAPTPPSPPSPPVPPTPVSPPGPSAGGPSPFAGGSAPGFPGPFGGGMAGPTPNTYPNPANVAPNVEQSHGHSHIKYVLAGGLVGYLLGRRRGRIKTEKRLLPVQQKLEKQVQDLQGKLFLREESVRRLSVRHREELQHKDRDEVQKVVKKERAKRAETLKVYETGVHKQPERLGKFALLPGAIAERQPSREQLGERQLLEVAKSITVGQVSLAEMYKRGRIEISDVREIVQEFLQGHDYERLITKAIKPERLENRPAGSQTTGTEAVGALRIDKLLPNIPGLQQPEDLRFGAEKETHLVARVGMVAGVVTAVVVVAVVLVLVLLGAL